LFDMFVLLEAPGHPGVQTECTEPHAAVPPEPPEVALLSGAKRAMSAPLRAPATESEGWKRQIGSCIVMRAG
jgi:hypothetical protein